MPLKKVKKPNRPDYPSYQEFHKERRRFIAGLAAGVATSVLAGSAMAWPFANDDSLVGPERLAGEVFVPPEPAKGQNIAPAQQPVGLATPSQQALPTPYNPPENVMGQLVAPEKMPKDAGANLAIEPCDLEQGGIAAKKTKKHNNKPVKLGGKPMAPSPAEILPGSMPAPQPQPLPQPQPEEADAQPMPLPPVKASIDEQLTGFAPQPTHPRDVRKKSQGKTGR